MLPFAGVYLVLANPLLSVSTKQIVCGPGVRLKSLQTTNQRSKHSWSPEHAHLWNRFQCPDRGDILASVVRDERLTDRRSIWNVHVP